MGSKMYSPTIKPEQALDAYAAQIPFLHGLAGVPCTCDGIIGIHRIGSHHYCCTGMVGARNRYTCRSIGKVRSILKAKHMQLYSECTSETCCLFGLYFPLTKTIRFC